MRHLRAFTGHLGGELGYVDGGAVADVFTTAEPFPVRLDLRAHG